MIGVFDSGLGGLSVLSAIVRASPGADLVYLADTAHLPYGNKSDEFICARVLAIGRYLVERGASSLVVACNTATAAALSALREQHPGIPVIGVEPGVKPAAAASRSGMIAVLATESTASSQRLSALIRAHAGGVVVHVEACPGWATRVETLQPIDRDSDPVFAAEVAAKISPLLDAGIDRLVLGCTHYSFLAPLIDSLIAGRAELVDVADAVARQVLRQSGRNESGSGRLELLSTATPARLDAALPALGLGWLADRVERPAVLAQI